ncbi:RNA polymerase IIA largest subunit, putative; 12353-6556 [Arabidopsis thaliana]|uniref:DNA-directed RNA polymerase IV subunit 1 n=4 Tax=Arabidopsis thaliana TaxID=3702 RepID=NRPD1_ARATH|nr:nuclear RNA polymerase D1A [Arabidopsis thaliana]NP_176490.2 nuclear RNA polymerase D1A [Arabidopsis thaliana]Q9LQ02.1 RecName: Full=DNA-directed RNA polymerase IV subunit 1; AltName: Full=DNA-directed RNA polymerase D subunit 1; Short=AtNRPD1a; Short=Nuclear RNA polymerase D 1a; AltName: Full=Protein RNA-DIRECTED DNA METHYLATION DEFECTIVE 3; AltName: Full=Protein SILENCING DEFECTIVE 4; AltName: Full=Protein SILENCING MOVEMENT DEFICIENT 2; AltName: Full=RNA polymerase IV subunit 1a; Short=POL |eukprot:NP_001185298.1 nuclear RNA polymerase D1A [Arabidopsis thaliana]
MEDDCEELQVPVGTLTSIGFSISNNNDRDKMSVLEVEAPNQVTDSRLGLPNPDSVCRTCGSKDRKVCEGHFGVINFAYSIINPYFLKEVAALLNKICPGCKYIRKKQFQITEDQPERCRYCTLNTGYPLMKFRVTTKEVFRRSGIVVEVNEESLMKLKKRGVLTLPPDYWSFLPQDSNIDESCLKPTRRIITHAQVYALLLGIDQRLIKKDIPMFNSLGLTSFPVTPNGYRVTEIVHQFNGARLIFDERTRIYKKLVGFEGNTLELSSRVMECMQYSRLFSETVSSSKDSANPYQKKSDTPKLCGLRFMKDVLLGKRSDHTFRTVVVGDPSLKLNEIGIPESIAKRLQVSEHLNQCNKERLVTSFVPTLLDNKEMHVRRGDRLVAIQVNDLQTGDKIFRSLMDGDTVLMNRPPSIHQHSLIAMTVRILPTTSVVSLNPICCLPFRGDFDGDCLHGYVPQSIQAKVELDELVALDKQLINRQNGRNLLSLGQDSLTAAYLVNVEKNCYLNRAQMQQLQMYCPFQLPPPAIIKASPSSTEPQWTGMQLFGMLFPPGFDYTYPLNNVVVSNGELLSFSEGSAWLRDGEGNFIERLLKHDKGKVLDIIYSAQEMLSQWLLMRGLSVSLADLYLSSDLQSRKNLTEEISYGLREAEQVCNKQQLMVESWRDFLAVNGEDKEEDSVSDLARFCYERQKSATLSELAVSAFKDAYRDVQALAYRYGDQSNSFLIMSKAGSKGNIGKLVQHSMCIGLQNSAVSLSFGFPRELTCAAWNDPNSPLRGAKGKDSTTTESYVPYGVIENSFLTGLNPLESFVHSVTSRDSSFSGNADLPGTLSRRLMFFMRDIYAAYDGTVRNSFGNQLVQFTYETDGPVEDITGEALGSLSACALSEAAYSALDQPISLLETSPLLNLKNVLECGSKKGQREQTMSLYLSEYLSKKKHGFEYGSLEIKNHLEKLSFSEIVSTSMIIFSPSSNTKVPLSPWVCHFHISEKVLKRKQLSAESVVSSLNEQYKSRNRELKLDIVDLDIQNTNHCSSDDQAMKDDNVCITVTVVEASKHSVLELDAIRLVLIPFLLDSPVKGDQGIKKVNILWTDRPKAPKRNGNHLAGELYLKVTMYGDRGKRNCWTALLETCLPIMDMIDWGRSHPDNIRQCCSVYGIDAGRSIFVANLESAVSDTGKEILREHLLLVADSLSVTGEFVALNAKGWSKQRQVESTPAPFTQACFSSPSQCFLKAAKEGVRDDLQGSIDALAWGKVPGFGTGDQFEIIISPKVHGFTTPVDVYDLLSSTKTMRRTNSAPKSDKATVQPFGLLHSAFLKDIKVLDGKGIPMSLLRTIFTWKNIELLSQSLKRILHSYEINELLNERDEGLVKMVLQLHPNSVEKIGPGVKGIRVAKSKHGDSCCFEVVRIDGTFEDFSYHKCVLGATKIIAPKKMNFYKSKYLKNGTLESGGFSENP